MPGPMKAGQKGSIQMEEGQKQKRQELKPLMRGNRTDNIQPHIFRVTYWFYVYLELENLELDLLENIAGGYKTVRVFFFLIQRWIEKNRRLEWH